MSVVDYEASLDLTACPSCRADEHGRCRGDSCTCRRPRCERLRATQDHRPGPKPKASQIRQGMSVVVELDTLAPLTPTKPTRESPMKEWTAEQPTVHCTQEGCERIFATEHARSVHLARTHGVHGQHPANQRKAEAAAALEPDDGEVEQLADAVAAVDEVSNVVSLFEPADDGHLVETNDDEAALPLRDLVRNAGEWADIGAVELRAFTTDDGRLLVRARFVEHPNQGDRT